MKRFVNLRFPVVVTCAIVAGIAFGFLFIRKNISAFWLFALLPVAGIICSPLLRFSKFKPVIFTLAAVIFSTVGAVGVYFKLNGYATSELKESEQYFIEATVFEKGRYDSGEYVTLSNVKANGKHIGGKIRAYISPSYGEFCDVDYKVCFTAKLEAYDLFAYGKLNYNVLTDVKYRCKIDGDLTSRYGFSLFGAINRAVRHTLYNSLDYSTASIAYAMITGNTDDIDDGSLSAFRYGGIAHIFAVSGLHIGIVYSLLRFVCKKTHLNKYATLGVCIIPLILYTGICGFTISSTRALIMCTVSALCRTFLLKYDSLNALSFSIIAILLINPLNLFNVGFQLSVCATGAIILLNKNISRRLKKLPQKLSGAITISLSAQAGTMPIMLTAFGYISGAGLLLNILIVPLLSIVFMLLFAVTFISAIIPPLAQVLVPTAALPLEFIISFLIEAGFEKSLIKGFGAGVFPIIYYLGIFALSDKFNIKLKYRLGSILCAVAFLCVYVPIKSHMPFGGGKIVVSAHYGGGQVLIKSSKENVLIVNENFNASHAEQLLNEYYSTNLDALIILGGENCLSALDTVNFDCDVYIYNGYINLQPFSKRNIIYKDSFSIGEVDFEFADGYAIIAKCGYTALGVCMGKNVPFKYCDVLVSDVFGECESNTAISFNDTDFANCVYDDGDFVFNFKLRG